MKQEYKISMKLFAFVMALLMLLVSLPMAAFAGAISTSTDGTSVNAENEESYYPQELEVVLEYEDLRQENVKQFLLSDGTSRAVVYSEPVHYLNDDGKWIDIDNSLSLSGNEYETNNKTQIKFANKSGSSKLLSIKDEEYKIDFTPLNTNKSNVIIENPQSNNGRKYDDFKMLKNLVSYATYYDIYDGVDLQYVLHGTSIKENIIVNEKSEKYEYSFEIQLNKLSASLINNEIVFSDYDTGVQKYKIPAPYMLDEGGEYSGNVSYALVQNSKWKYTFTVTADAGWINASDRAFPVTIDPSVIANSTIMDTYTSDYTENGIQDDNSSFPILYVGKFPFFNDARAYIKFNSLPTLPEGSVLTHAMLTLHTVDSQTSDNSVNVGAYRITGTWQDSTIQYNSNKNYLTETNPVDYLTVFGFDNFIWDVTEIAKDWYYNGFTNYGICLKAISDATTYVNFASAENVNDAEPPMFEISYYYAKGIIDYHAHFTSNVGAAGIGYIDSFNGNMSFVHSITSTADEIMPYSVGITYDNLQKQWINSFDETITPLELEDGDSRYLWTDGDGSVHCFAPYKKINSYGAYVYYEFNPSGVAFAVSEPSIFYDEEGLGLNLTINSYNEYVIKDDKGNQKVFSSNGKLARICDTLGNVRNFNYNSSGLLTSISLTPNGLTSPIEQIVLTHNNGKLLTVENKQSKIIAAILRTGGNISSVRYDYYNANKSEVVAQYTVSYEYDESNNLVLAKDEKVGAGISYSYNSNGAVQNIKEIFYDGENSVYGSMGSIEYETKKTVYRSSKTQTQTSEDILTVYTFDNSGRVITAYSTDITGKTIYGATNYEYNNKYDSPIKNENNQETDIFKMHNSVRYVLESGVNTINLIKNPTFNEDTSSWQYTNTENSLIEVEDIIQGDENYGKTLRVCTTTLIDTPVFEIYQNVYLYEGVYTFSVDVNKRGMLPSSNIKLKIYNSSGEMVASSTSILAHENNTAELNDYWEKTSLQFDILSSGTYKACIEFEKTQNAVENLYFDNVVLERGTGLSGLSLYENGDFNNSISSSDLRNATIIVPNGYDEKLVKATSNLTKESYVKYSVAVGNDFNKSGWVISAWAKAENCIASANTEKSTAKFAIQIIAKLRDSNETINKYINFNTSTSEWQYVTFSLDFIKLEDDQKISEIDIYLCYDYNVGYAYFDKVSFCQSGKSFSYEYNGLGNITSVTDSNGNKTVYKYEGGNAYNVTEIENQNGKTYNVSYDSANNVTSESTEHYGVSYSRNSMGQIDSTLIADKDNPNNRMITSSTYYLSPALSSYSKVNTSTDERGNVTTYLYDDFGRLKGTYLNNDEGILYTYNAYGQILSSALAKYNASSGELESLTTTEIGDIINYKYNDDLSLKEIKTSNSTYAFSYDIYGNMTAINIGNKTLSEYVYEEFNGNLESMEYGNGPVMYYAYDELDRLVGVKYDTETSYSTVYTYASNGDLSTVYDAHNNTTYYYYYDANSKLISEKATIGTSTLYDIYYAYDSQGRLINKSIYYPGHESKQVSNVSYEYNDDNLIRKITNSNGESIEYTYDMFNRISDIRKSYETTVLGHSYRYASGQYNDGDTSWLISEDIFILNNSTVSTTDYTYDDRGNITSVNYGENNGVVSYEYDDKNQLIRENNQKLGYTYLFYYDYNGNLRYKETRDYTLELTSVIEQTMPLSFENYSFNDADWGDLRTGYMLASPTQQAVLASGNTTYDNIGNPLTYYNGKTYNFNWIEGRRLSTAIVDGNTYTFKYNQDGIRIEKVSNGTKYEYTLEGTKIVRQTETSVLTGEVTKDTLFYYDQNGYISSATVYVPNTNDGYTQYNLMFLTNIQGDVISIYNTSGTNLVEFTYDAWGNFVYNIVGTPSTEQQIALETPFRYRSYYFDSDIQLYYLNSRYYDAKMCRFINADGYTSTGQDLNGNNMFTYCGNNPVIRVDSTGNFWEIVAVGALLIGVLFLAGCDEPSVGMAPDYVEISEDTNAKRESSPNCYTYSIGIYDRSLDPGECRGLDLNNGASSREISNEIILDVISMGGSARPLKKYNSPINDNEFRIAVRTSKGYRLIMTPEGPALHWDYHVMVQTSDGGWAERTGHQSATRYYEIKNPKDADWVGGFYNDEIIYIAISWK